MSRRILSIGIVLLAALVRMWRLGGESLWMDEAFSHLFATLPLPLAWQAMVVDAVHPPLYYLLLRPWLALAGESEFALRFPSALVGVLTVALVLRLGRAWFDGRAARWSALLLALNPFHIWYSQEGRMYALLGFLSLAVIGIFEWALQSRRQRVWVALGVVSGLAYVTHYFALYLPLVEFIFLIVTFRRYHKVLLRWVVVQALAVLPLAGWLTALYATAGGAFGIGWISRPSLADLLRTFWSFGIAYDGRVTVLMVVGFLIWGGLLVLGIWRGPGRRRMRGLLALSFFLPPLVTFLLSLRRPTYVDRFFIGSLPAFLLLAGVGLRRLPYAYRWALGVILILGSVWGVARFHFDPAFAKEDWRGAMAYVEAHERTGDGLVLRQFQYVVPLNYYYRGRLKSTVVTWNQETTPLEEIAAGHRRIWMVFRARHDDLHHLAWSQPFDLVRDETEPVVIDWVAAHPAEEVRTFPGVTVMLFELAANP